LVPLFLCVGLGVGMSGLYLFRLSSRSPDVQWDRKGNPRPWDELDGKNYKVNIRMLILNIIYPISIFVRFFQFYTTRDNYDSKAPKLE
jgi:hypothetical protein